MDRFRSSIATVLLFHFLVLYARGQQAETAPLFQDEQPLSAEIDISLSEIKKSKSDSIYFSTILRYKDVQGIWDSIPITVRARGNFRRKHCFFPPMRIKIDKGNAKGTLFAGTKSLKLVLPCQVGKNANDLILKEYVCYQLYKPITSYVFNTRLVYITLYDQSGKQPKVHKLTAFFIEDDDAAARRLLATVVDEPKFNPMHLEDTSSLRLDLFQYMIANTDFSTTFTHNLKVVRTKTGKLVPIAYDFDMAGFVNAPYATFDETLGIKGVHERVYKGYRRKEGIMEFVRQEFIQHEDEISGVMDRNRNYFEPKEFGTMKKYLTEFFKTIKNDAFYREQIVRKCRTPK
jgi:hypothetical protein